MIINKILIKTKHTLLSSVAQSSGFVRTRRPRSAMQFSHLPILPAADTQQVPHNITLLFPIQLLYILVGTHVAFFWCLPGNKNTRINLTCGTA